MPGKIPQAFIDDLVARIDLVELIDSRLPLKKSGSNYVACCPFHSEKTPSFSVSPDKQLYYCFGCGAGGNAISFLMDHDRLGFVEAIEDLAAHAGIPVPRTSQQPDSANLTPIYELQRAVASFYTTQLRQHPTAKTAIAYLKARGLSGEIAARYGIGYAPPGWNQLGKHFDPKALLNAGLLVEKETGERYDRFRNRIMFPIRDRRGRVIGFGGRVLDDTTPKYLNSPETPVFHKAREAYGLYELLKAISKPSKILVVEGYMDVIALAQHGIPYAAAALGTAASLDLFNLLFRYTRELVLCFDGDAAGQKAAWRAVESALPALRDGRQIRIMLLPAGEDPDSLVRSEGSAAFEQRIMTATALSDHFFQHLSEEIRLDEMEGRSRLVETAMPLIAKLPDGVFKTMMRARAAELARIAVVEQAKSEKAPPPKRSGEATADKKLSPLRTAIILLIQNPRLATFLNSNSDEWTASDAPGIELLKRLLEITTNNPAISPGGILEHFRGKKEEKLIQKLLHRETLIPPEGIEDEFKGALMRISEQFRRQRLDELLIKASRSDLTGSERQEMRELFERSVVKK